MDTEHKIPWSKKLGFRLLVSFLFTLCLFLVLAGSIIYKQAKNFLEEKELAQITTANNAIINDLLYQTSYVSSLAHSVASTSSRLPLDNSKFKRVIKRIFAAAPRQSLLAGGGVWPEPFLFNTSVERNSFFWGKDEQGELQFFNNYNYIDTNGYHQEAWYVPSKFIEKNKHLWSGSYIDPHSLAPMVTVSVPIYKGAQFFGVSTVDMNLSIIDEYINRSWEKQFPGYSFLVDMNGKLISKISAITTPQATTPYPTVAELSATTPEFAVIVDAIDAVTNNAMLTLGSAQVDQQLKTALAAESYQISEQQAALIASAIHLQKNELDLALNHEVIHVDSAPLIDQPGFIIVTEMPETHWKIVNVLPESHILTEVNQGLSKLLLPLIVISAVILVLFYIFMETFFIRKVTDITHQLINTDLSKSDSQISTNDKGELGLITRLINEHIYKLRNLTHELSDSKHALELRVKISQALQHPVELKHLLTEVLAAICNSKALELQQSAAIVFLNRSGLPQEIFAQYGNFDINDIANYAHKKTSDISIDTNKYIVPLELDNKNRGIIVLYATDLISDKDNQNDLDTLAYIGYMINLAVSNEASRIDLIEEKAKAEKASQAKSDFLASMSHELRTPLNAILGFSQLLKKNAKPSLTDQQNQQLEFIIDGGKHLLRLINQVLELSAIESGKIKLDLQDVSLQESVSRTIDLVQSIATDNNVYTHIDTDSELILRADRTKLDQILLNLVSNAIKYNCFNGEVHIRWKKLNHDFAQIEIEDTGIGIAKEKFDAVFDPFNRLGLESSNIEGTGIGLSVTKDLIELMGGTIYFKSLINKGTTFYVELPVALDLLDMDFPPIEDNETTGTNTLQISNDLQVLYVEDIPTNQALMKSFFKQWNQDLAIDIADNAEMARTMLEQETYNLILMDLNLPGESGVDLTASLKNDDRYSHLPIVALTARAMRDDVHEIEDLFDAYITKPVNFAELTTVLEQHLGISM